MDINDAYIEDTFRLYQTDPSLVDESWRIYFQSRGLDFVPSTSITPLPTVNGFHAEEESSAPLEKDGHYLGPATAAGVQERVYRLISAFRSRGHFEAHINPLSKGIVALPTVADVQTEFYRFTDQQLEQQYYCAGLAGHTQMPLADIIKNLQQAYCSSIGFEFTHLLDQRERIWLQSRIERRFENGYRLSEHQRLRRLQKIIDAEAFESELHKKYIGHKRFSLQGAETLIPMLDTLLEQAGEHGVSEVVLGMSHRGRLNVLANTLGKPLEEIFTEFQDQSVYSALGSGDVKYHMGFHSTYLSPSGQRLDLLLASNPSHLEFVDPVVEGKARALGDTRHGGARRPVLPVLIHGDAAFAGQGVVFETLNMSNVAGYTTGGTVHIVVNNQIGFTTTPDESRSSVYCTDMAKAVQAPVFHVNGEDVEAACWVVKAALDFRNTFGRDALVDLYCYRRFGHNEGDDPSFTQPLSYEEIEQKDSIATLYSRALVQSGAITEAQVQEYHDNFKQRFEAAHARAAQNQTIGDACPTHGKLGITPQAPEVQAADLEVVASSLIHYPDWFHPHPKLKKILEKRVQTLEAGEGIDWGFAEALAFGTLMLEGKNIRLSGQDSGRGTFSQRHLSLDDHEMPQHYLPLSRLTEEHAAAGRFEVVNSTLSEAGVLGFEFGYSTIDSESLVLWEAQFGDFVNGAQIHIDQFIVASEAKWDERSGVVLLLPHGYEGQGPEHSSARFERFLQLCAEGNMVVSYPSNAAQYFHLLRRHAHARLKRPLVVMTPKSLLRLADAMATTPDLLSTGFQRILVDEGPATAGSVLCSGKVYYDLKKALAESELDGVQIVRMEQFYPFPEAELRALFDSPAARKSLVWLQEEPKNMGGYAFVSSKFRELFGVELHYAGRAESASTATGSAKHHAKEQKQLLQTALGFLERS